MGTPLPRATPKFEPFVLLTSRLIIIPTPISIELPEFRAMYAHIHSLPAFCNMAFGPHWPPRDWTDEQCKGSINAGMNACWKIKGMGDFSVGLLPAGLEEVTSSGENRLENVPGKKFGDLDVRFVQGEKYASIAEKEDFWSTIQWVGYAGVRDAVSSKSMPSELAASPSLPPWEEMVEIRYGCQPASWGKGYATEAARAVMAWAVQERGTRRFIAETEKENTGSGKVLGKLGFVARAENEYWGEESEIEWEMVV